MRNMEDYNLDDEDEAQRLFTELYLIINARQGFFEALAKIIAGNNIFTPALLNRGWKFWRHSPLTNEEERTLMAAYDRFWGTMTDDLNESTRKFSSVSDSKTELLLMATTMQSIDASFSCESMNSK